MKALIIDDVQKYAEEVAGSLKCAASIVEGKFNNSTSHDIASLISDWVNGDKESIVFINLSLRYGSRRRQEHAGIEVLKYLRFAQTFSGRTNTARDVHCVLYSYLTAEQLLRQGVDNAIVTSEGVTLISLPFSPARLDPEGLSTIKARVDLEPYIRGEFTLPDERHDWANWWGIKQLCDVHRVVVADPALTYPPRVELELKDLRTQQAVYLYGIKPGEMIITGNLSKRIHKLRKEIGDRAPRILHVDDLSEEGWSDILAKIFYSANDPPVEGVIGSAATFNDYHVDGRTVFRALRLPKGEAGGDVGDEGRVDNLYGSVRAALTTPDFEADLILLDLRLFGEAGAHLEVEKISGARILARLRAEAGGTPVIMTTASNKAWTFEQLMQIGADGFWMKEGLDERNSPQASMRNYRRLLRLVAAATGEHYTFLKEMKRCVDGLRAAGRHWWQSMYWPHVRDIPSQTSPDGQVIFNILETTVQMLRTFLHQHVMKVGFQSAVVQNFWSCAIIRHAANILEEVHRFDDLPPDFRTRGTIGGYEDRRTGGFKVRRGDWFAYSLYAVRNDASHHDRARNVDWLTLKTFLADLVCYLSYRPQFKSRKPLTDLREEDGNYKSLFDRLTGPPRPDSRKS